MYLLLNIFVTLCCIYLKNLGYVEKNIPRVAFAKEAFWWKILPSNISSAGQFLITNITSRHDHRRYHHHHHHHHHQHFHHHHHHHHYHHHHHHWDLTWSASVRASLYFPIWSLWLQAVLFFGGGLQQITMKKMMMVMWGVENDNDDEEDDDEVWPMRLWFVLEKHLFKHSNFDRCNFCNIF